MKNLTTTVVTVITIILTSTTVLAKEQPQPKSSTKQCQKQCTIQFRIPEGTPKAPCGATRGSATR